MAESQAYEFGEGDWTIEHWSKPLTEDKFHHIAKVRKNVVWTYYLDGAVVDPQTYAPFDPTCNTLYVNELRISKVAREIQTQQRPEVPVLMSDLLKRI